MNPQVIIIAGPTGVGKSYVAEQLASLLPAEIVNADVGQCYAPLTIGTAKPAWQHSPITHHLFDHINEPRHYSIVEYRKDVERIVHEIWQRKRIPIIVGGSTFYINSLFFPIQSLEETHSQLPTIDLCEDGWHALQKVDPERAASIHPHDTYRLRRALTLWYRTGKKPSALAPQFEPLAPSWHMLFVERNIDNLKQIIAQRVEHMLAHGWYDEGRLLLGTAWESFVRTKNIIGYDLILDALHDDTVDRDGIETLIVRRTCQYAKKQNTFWRRLERLLRAQHHAGTIERLNLTLFDLDLYIKQQFSHFITSS